MAKTKKSGKGRARGSAKTPRLALTKPRTTRVNLKVDSSLKKRWSDAVKVIQASKRGEAVAFDELWETIGIVIEHDPPLYLAGGIATAGEFLESYVEETERTAMRWIRVAKYASPDEEAKYGISRLDAAIAFLEAKNGGPAKWRIPVDFDKLNIPVRDNGKSQLVPLAKASVEQVRAATREILRHGKRGHPAGSPIVTAITEALGKGPLRDVRVSVSQKKLTLSGIPIDQLATLAKALSAVQLPEPV